MHISDLHWTRKIKHPSELYKKGDPIEAVVLDIDVFRTSGVATDEAELWEQLLQLRHEKNRVFESCITDEARRLFQ